MIDIGTKENIAYYYYPLSDLEYLPPEYPKDSPDHGKIMTDDQSEYRWTGKPLASCHIDEIIKNVQLRDALLDGGYIEPKPVEWLYG